MMTEENNDEWLTFDIELRLCWKCLWVKLITVSSKWRSVSVDSSWPMRRSPHLSLTNQKLGEGVSQYNVQFPWLARGCRNYRMTFWSLDDSGDMIRPCVMWTCHRGAVTSPSATQPSFTSILWIKKVLVKFRVWRWSDYDKIKLHCWSTTTRTTMNNPPIRGPWNRCWSEKVGFYQEENEILGQMILVQYCGH